MPAGFGRRRAARETRPRRFRRPSVTRPGRVL